ncbi:TonB-dependent receptor [Nibricoccus sp. IMCC34717]|uniref:TonB-dependent receptor n=1 Tax=Nibricoccus sp. IMCC34717 TaxID=3034021 RepID=UPI00384C9D37
MSLFRFTLAATAVAAPLCLRGEATASLDLVHLDDYLVETNASTFRLKAPAVTHQVLRDDLQALNLPETGDALQYLPNVFIRKRFIGDKNALTSIRGTSNRQPGRTLVLADGIPLSNFLGTGFGNSPRWFLVAPDEIEKIAVSYGPYSALYAGNSIGGTVLFTTSMPSAFTGTARGQWFTQNFREYGTRRDFVGRTGYVAAGDRRGRFSWLAFANHLENDSHPMTFAAVNTSQTSASGSGAVDTTGAFTDRDPTGAARILYGSAGPTEAIHDLFKLKLGCALSDDTHLRYTLIYWKNQENTLAPESYLRDSAGNPVWSGKVAAAGRVFTVPANAFPLSRRSQADLVNALTVAHEPETGLQLALTASWYDVLRDKSFASTTALPSALAGGAGQATVLGRTGWQTLDALLGWHGEGDFWASHAPSVGWHKDHYFTRQGQWAMTDWTRPDARTALTNGTGGATRTSAFFGQDAWRFAPGFTATAGIRWETWRAGDGFRARDFSGNRVETAYPTREYSAWSPKFALSWKPSQPWQMRLSLARAVRFPTVGELFQGGVSANGSLTQNDPDLRSERDFAKDLTVEHSLTGGGSLRASIFEEDVKDALVNQSTLRPDGTSFTGVQNVGRVRTRGAELAVQKRDLWLKGFSLDASLSYTRAAILENVGLPASVGRQFPRIPRWQAKVVASQTVTRTVTVSAAVRYSSYQYNTLDNSDPFGGYGGTDAFWVADVKASWAPARGWTLSAGVDNLNDRRYHVFHPMPGRTWILEAQWKL